MLSAVLVLVLGTLTAQACDPGHHGIRLQKKMQPGSTLSESCSRYLELHVDTTLQLSRTLLGKLGPRASL